MRGGGAGNGIGSFHPSAQVDHPTPFRTEREEGEGVEVGSLELPATYGALASNHDLPVTGQSEVEPLEAAGFESDLELELPELDESESAFAAFL